MDETTKKSPLTSLANAVRPHKDKILVVTTVASLGAAVAMGRGLKQHNDFLKEKGLFEEFYQITPEVPVN